MKKITNLASVILMAINLLLLNIQLKADNPCPYNELLNGKKICTDVWTRCDPPPRGFCVQKEKDCQCIKNPFTPDIVVTSNSKWIEQSGLIIPPAPGFTVNYTFNIDVNYPNAYYKIELNDYFTGQTIQAQPLSGTVTVAATRRLPVNEQNLIDFKLVSSNINAQSVSIPNLGPTGINHITYDSLQGLYDLNTGRSILAAIGRITNAFFFPQDPLQFTTYQWATINLGTGEMLVDSKEFDHPPIIWEGFTDASFPPLSWNVSLTGISYWSRDTVSSYGIGSGCSKFSFRNAPFSTTQSLITKNFMNSSGGDSLKFDQAYAPFPSGTDSLIIETSIDYGVSYTTLIKLWGRASGGPLNTAPVTALPFTPISGQWVPRKYALVPGTNKVRFRAISGFGNNLYLDSIRVGKFVNNQVVSSIAAAPEGFYNTATDNLNMDDTVTALLKANFSPYNTADSGRIVIDSVSLTGSIMFNNAASGVYYVVLKHRNSIETWSKSGGESFTHGVQFSYDFTTLQTQSFGNNATLRGTIWCVYSGDVNQDGSVDLTDIVNVFNDANSFLSGYVTTDVTGDKYVDLSDLTVTYNNSNSFVSVIKP